MIGINDKHVSNQKPQVMKPPIFNEGNVIYSAGTCSALADAALRGAANFNAFVRGQYPGRPLPKNALPGLRTVGFRNVTDKPYWGSDWHRNEGIEVVFLLHGKDVYETGTEHWKLNVGDVVVTPPWLLHRFGDPYVGIGTILWFIIDVQVRSNDQSPKWPSWIILSEKDKNRLSQLCHGSSHVFHLAEKHIHPWKKLDRILRADSTECPVSSLAITINDLLNELLEVQSSAAKYVVDSVKSQTRAETTVQLFFDRLRMMPALLEHPWTIPEMAKICQVSPTSFTKYCRRLTNLSPLNALNQMRVRRAETLLRNEPQKSITEIAMECGFTTSQYFATVFKKWNGKTPSEFKNGLAPSGGEELQERET